MIKKQHLAGWLFLLGVLATLAMLLVFLSTRISRSRFESVRALDYQPKIFNIKDNADGVRLEWERGYARNDDYCLPGENFNKVVIVKNSLPIAITSGLTMVEYRPPVTVGYRIRNAQGELLPDGPSKRSLISPDLPPTFDPATPAQATVALSIECPKEIGDYTYTAEIVQDGVAWQSDVLPAEKLLHAALHVRSPAQEKGVPFYGLARFSHFASRIDVSTLSEDELTVLKQAYLMAINTLSIAVQRASLGDVAYLVASPGSAYPAVWVRDMASVQKAWLHVMHDKRQLYPHWADFFLRQAELSGGGVPDWVELGAYQNLLPRYDQNSAQVDQPYWLVLSILDAYAAQVVTRVWLDAKASKQSELRRGDTMIATLRRSLELYWDRQLHCLKSAHVADWGDVAMFGASNAEATSGGGRNLKPQVCGIFQQALLYLTLDRMLNEFPFKADNPDHVTAQQEWQRIRSEVRGFVQDNLWQGQQGFFAIHKHVDEFKHDFAENDIFALGGNLLAIEAGLANYQQRQQIVRVMLDRQKNYQASTIGAVLLPPYPAGTFEHPMMNDPFEYQNGGQWDWYGCRAAAMLYRDNRALGLAQMLDIAKNAVRLGQFSEWYDLQGHSAQGSPHYRAAAAEFVHMIHSTILRRDDAQK